MLGTSLGCTLGHSVRSPEGANDGSMLAVSETDNVGAKEGKGEISSKRR